MTAVPCELHEMTGCGFCNGADARLKESLETPYGEYEPGERIAPGIVASSFPGICSGCGLNYGIGSPIRHQDGKGWVATGCCG